jgi:sugar phosphate isomerase/epimerase
MTRFGGATGPVLWSGTVRASPLAERIAAAATAGYSELSLSPSDYRRAGDGGLTGRDMRRMVEDAGLAVACFDPFTKWLPEWNPPAHLSPEAWAVIGADESEFLTAAEALGARSMTVFEPFGTRWPDEVAAECLATIARRAADAGLQVNVEFIPFLGIPDLAAAWRIVQLCGVDAVGIVIDMWHYFRGTPDDELLASIPGDRIGAVQVCDAAREPVVDLETDCLHHRLPAGDGTFALDRVRRILASTGGLRRVGPEIFSDAFDRRPALDNARHARQGLQPWLDPMSQPQESPA